jgi:hypothetical protein
MKSGRILATIAMLCATNAVSAQTATQIVTIQVNAINQISFSGSPSLTISTAVAGNAPTSVTNSTSATWAVTTNQSNAKITASLNSDVPTGLTLWASLGAPAGSTGIGNSLSTTSVDLVTGITKLAQSGLQVIYSLDATAAAGVVASTTRTVTYTITGGT